MAGGLLNLIAEGTHNIILTGEPSKTFFKVTYSKYTNFGLQKFRLDYDGMRELRTSTESTFKFKVKRYGDLLMDTYLVVNLPDIWSPFYNPQSSTLDNNGEFVDWQNTDGRWAPYDFKWIENIGTHMIKEIEITCGSLTLQKYTGEYLAAMVERDFDGEKKKLFNEMSGNLKELNDPAFSMGRVNTYPSAFYTQNPVGAEPSIRGRPIYIPINAWFTLDSKCAFPLVSLQYSELEISITLRPIKELFVVRDVFDSGNEFPYVAPDFNEDRFQMYRFLQTPPHPIISSNNYDTKINTWNADIHIVSTYGFLSKDEAQLFAMKEQMYLVKDVFRYDFQNVTGSKRLKLTSSGMVANWMFYLQRNDVNMRNQWSNYTNWPYGRPPIAINNVILDISGNNYFPQSVRDEMVSVGALSGPRQDPKSGKNTGFFMTGDFSVENHKHILQTMGIILDGEYRENTMTRGIYDYIEKYVRTKGYAKEGLYCYNFCINTDPLEYQPSGAINMSKFNTIELEITTHAPAFSDASDFQTICDNDGNIIGTNKSSWRLFDYNYNMTVFEERYNVLSFVSGQCGMMIAR
jgi:hypothetical protein